MKYLKHVQSKQSVRLMCRNWQASYMYMMYDTSELTFRLEQSTWLYFKILKGVINVNSLKNLSPASRIGRNDHGEKLNIPFARPDCFE